MGGRRQAANDPQRILREAGLRLAEVVEGVACAGTKLEKRTLAVRGKAFLFLGASDAMLKLRDSLPEATAVARRFPDGCKVGGHGWITLKFGTDSPSVETLVGWIEESYRLFAPKRSKEIPSRSGTAEKPRTKSRKTR